MGGLPILISAISCFLFWKAQSKTLMIISIFVFIGTFWSYGIMHNFATEAAKKRNSYVGGFNDFTEKEVGSAPDWITGINMIMSIIGIILLVTSIIIIIRT
mgnify:CR=1 FL=1